MSRHSIVNVVLALIAALAMSYVWPGDDQPTAAHRDAIESVKQEAHIARAEMAISSEMGK